MSSSTAKQEIRKSIYRIGVTGVVITLLTQLLFYLISYRIVHIYGAYILIIPFLAGIAAAIKQRERQNGYLNFGQAVETSMLVFLMGNIAYTLCFVLLLMLDKHMLSSLADIQRLQLTEGLKTGKFTQAEYNENMIGMQHQGIGTMIKASMFAFFIFSIFALVLNLISSSIIRNERYNRS